MTLAQAWATLWQMRLIVCSILFLGVCLGGSGELLAQSPAGGVQLISGSARISRGRVRFARGAATHRALLTAVWRWVQPKLASTKGQRRLKRRLSKRVRKLIKRYRTRKVSRAGRKLTVLLAVTVDEPALRARLQALRVRLKKPGVLLVAHCGEGQLAPTLTRALGSMSIRVVAGPWPVERRAAMVQIAKTRPAAVVDWARKAYAAVVVMVRCETRTLTRIAATGVTGVRSKIVAVAYGAMGAIRGPGKVRQLVRVDQSGLGHHVDVKKAGQAALVRALGKLAPRLGRALPPVLPTGLTRTLLVRLRGPLGLATLLKMARGFRAQLHGVHAVTPQRFGRGVTWLAVRTSHDPSQLQKILTTFRPPPGWLLRVGKGPRPGTVDVTAELTEDS